MQLTSDKWESEKDRGQLPGGDDTCTLGKILMMALSPSGTKINCPVHGHHMLYGRKYLM